MLEEKKAANTIDGCNIGSVDLARMLEMCIGEGHCGYQGEDVCPLRSNVNCLFDLARMAAERIRALEQERVWQETLLAGMKQVAHGADLCYACEHSRWPDDCPMDCMECGRTDCACRECKDYGHFALRANGEEAANHEHA